MRVCTAFIAVLHVLMLVRTVNMTTGIGFQFPLDLLPSHTAQHAPHPVIPGIYSAFDIGRAKQNLLPFPGSLSTHILPPWASTISLTIANPMPVPP